MLGTHRRLAAPPVLPQVRAFGLMLADMVQRLDISFQGEGGESYT